MRTSSLIVTLVIAATFAGPITRAQESIEPAKPRGETSLAAAREGITIAPSASPVTLPRTEQFDLRAKSGLEYRIFVAGPTGEVPVSGSPVIYLSDGYSNFPVLLNAARRLSRDAHPAVIVGIGYPSDDGTVHRERRSFDLTPGSSTEMAKAQQGETPPLKTAGNDEFLKFINQELKPVIEQKYKVNRDRQTLFGHSFGGLFVLHVLFSEPESFQTYLASSPSLWWNNGGILAEQKTFAASYANKEVKARLLITIGEWEQKAAPQDTKERADVLEQRRMVGNAKDLASRLAASQIKGLTITFREFAEEEHGSVVLPAASRGVRYALEER